MPTHLNDGHRHHMQGLHADPHAPQLRQCLRRGAARPTRHTGASVEASWQPEPQQSRR